MSHLQSSFIKPRPLERMEMSVFLDRSACPYNGPQNRCAAGDQKNREVPVRVWSQRPRPAIVDRGPEIFSVSNWPILLYPPPLKVRPAALMPKDRRAESRVSQWLNVPDGRIGPMMGHANSFYRDFPEKAAIGRFKRYHNECRRLSRVWRGSSRVANNCCDD